MNGPGSMAADVLDRSGLEHITQKPHAALYSVFLAELDGVSLCRDILRPGNNQDFIDDFIAKNIFEILPDCCAFWRREILVEGRVIGKAEERPVRCRPDTDRINLEPPFRPLPELLSHLGCTLPTADHTHVSTVHSSLTYCAENRVDKGSRRKQNHDPDERELRQAAKLVPQSG